MSLTAIRSLKELFVHLFASTFVRKTISYHAINKNQLSANKKIVSPGTSSSLPPWTTRLLVGCRSSVPAQIRMNLDLLSFGMDKICFSLDRQGIWQPTGSRCCTAPLHSGPFCYSGPVRTRNQMRVAIQSVCVPKILAL